MRHKAGLGKGYAYRKREKKTLLMHRLIMGEPVGHVIDHMNGNGLDNRRKNLRITTLGANTVNTAKLRNGATSKYVGVHWCRTAKRWVAKSRKDGIMHLAGYFRFERDAAEAAKALRLRLWGEDYRGW